MRKFGASLLVVIAFLGAVYFVGDRFFPDEMERAIGLLKETVQRQDANHIEFVMAMNLDLTSDLAAVFKCPQTGEGIAVFTKTIDRTEFVDRMVLKGPDDEIALIAVNEYGLPTGMEVAEHLVLFDNYTSTTVDITVTRPDGTVETLDAAPIAMPASDETAWRPIRPAHAEDFRMDFDDFAYTNRPEAGSSRKDVSGYEVTGYGYLEYMKAAPGTVMNIVGCTVGLASLLPSAGFSAPLALGGCGLLAVRIATTDTEIGPCHGDIIKCGTDAIVDFVAGDDDGPALGDDGAEKKDDSPIFDLFGDADRPATDGLYRATFSGSSLSGGLTSDDEGSVTATFSDEEGTCSLKIESSVSGSPEPPSGAPAGIELPFIRITAHAESTTCTGTIDRKTGEFELAGFAAVEIKTASSGQPDSGDIMSSGPFSLTGFVKDGVMTGQINFWDKTLELLSN